MKKKHKTDEVLAHVNPNAVVANGLEEAYVGYIRRANRPTVAVYDYVSCINVLMRDEDFTRRQAVKFMEEFILEHDAGESSPAFAFWKDEHDENQL